MLARLSGVFQGGRFRAVAIAAAATFCLGAVAVGHAAVTGPSVLKVRLGGTSAETRIVIDLGRSATGKVASDGAADRRVVLNLAGATTDGSLQGGSQGLVKSWVMDQTATGARLRVDLAAEGAIKRRFLLPPADGVGHYRYVIDVAARGAAPAARPSAPGVRLTSTVLPVRTASAPARATPLSLKKVIVIDAGHGGRDPGSHGRQGNEKDINLAAAKALKARLERSGRYKVVMTRDTDAYIPLETRVQIARRADADLFISLHADSGPDTATRGTSVYTLSEKAANRAAKFVNKDDWFMKASHAGGVSDILFDLTQRATKNRSAGFAEVLLDHIDDHTTLLRRSHRDAGFVVLLAPDVPAVLLEMGFVTNAEDEAMLRDPARRGRLMNAVGDAIDDYFAQATRLAAR